MVRRGEFHAGETAVQQRIIGSPILNNPTSYGLPLVYALRAAASPLMAVGVLDADGHPWTSIWSRKPAQHEEEVYNMPTLCKHIAPNILEVSTFVDVKYDPVVDVLFKSSRQETSYKSNDLMAALTLDFQTRDRVKLSGRFTAGGISQVKLQGSGTSHVKHKQDLGPVGDVKMTFLLQESLGNCPKYINKKDIKPIIPQPEVVRHDGEKYGSISQEAERVIKMADMFFISSWDGKFHMDVNHRGGSPGFLRVAHVGRSGHGAVLIWPEYSGNRLYQTLGNLHQNPQAGLTVPDYKTGDVLYLTGKTSILYGEDAAITLPHSKLAVKFTATKSSFIRKGLSFIAIDTNNPSPYNPAVWPLACELIYPPTKKSSASASHTASLKKREVLTQNIARLTFSVAVQHYRTGYNKRMEWEAGQHITLSFAEKLDMGYAHMCDNEPQSLNDDFVRTFTISNPPPRQQACLDSGEVEMEITVRKHGPITGLLFSHPVSHVNPQLQIPVLGVSGEPRFRIPIDDTGEKSIFVAGGMGITPLLAQAPGLILRGRDFEVVWSVRAEDLYFVVDSIKRIYGLGDRMSLFITRAEIMTTDKQWEGGLFSKVQHLVRKTEVRRVSARDLLVLGEKDKRRFYCCTGSSLKKTIISWLSSEPSEWEDFSY